MKKAIIAVCVLFCMVLPGCVIPNTQQPGESAPQYNTQFPLTALEYTIITNKEIALVMNILETHMSNGRNVIRSRYPIEDEIKNAEHSLIMTGEAIKTIDTLYPAITYEDDRLEILRRMENALNSLENYKTALEGRDMEMTYGLIDVMQGDFVSLKGMFNIVWE